MGLRPLPEGGPEDSTPVRHYLPDPVPAERRRHPGRRAKARDIFFNLYDSDSLKEG